jgi:nitroreductase
MNIIEKLNWRYATKKFNATYQLTDEELTTVKEIIQLSPASFGLQPYKVLIVMDNEKRNALKEASYGQTQITDSSALLVFVKNKNVNDGDVDAFVQNIVETRGVPKEMLAEYEGMMKYAVNSMDEATKGTWVEKQIYLALGNLLTSLSTVGIDACPMEGFDKTKYNEILGLTDTESVVVCPIGKRDWLDETQHYKKVRKSQTELFEVI